MLERRLMAWLRPAFTIIGIAGLLTLVGCGGGSGAPNNPYVPPTPTNPPLVVLPNTITVYAGIPATLTVTGGFAPFRVFSSDPALLPVPATVAGDTIVLFAASVTTASSVTVTVQDAAGATDSTTVSVTPSPLLPNLITVTGNPNPACAATSGTICSGGSGTAAVKVTGPGGAGIAGRSVRFDVVQGSFAIQSTNPAQPLVSTLTVVSDVNGDAVVALAVPPNTPTQVGIIRATDITTGNQVTGNFTILQTTVGGAVLSVLPQGNTTITGPTLGVCSTGVTVTHFIFGGTPPYTVSTNFPGSVTLSGVPVFASGGGFNTTTNGACFTNLTYVITDATGLTIPGGSYPTVTNQPGTTPPPPPPPGPLTATPGAFAKAGCVPSNTFQFILTGGTPPYSAVTTATVSITPPVIVPQTGIASGALVTVSNLSGPPIPTAIAGDTVISIFDSAVPAVSTSVRITCS